MEINVQSVDLCINLWRWTVLGFVDSFFAAPIENSHNLFPPWRRVSDPIYAAFRHVFISICTAHTVALIFRFTVHGDNLKNNLWTRKKQTTEWGGRQIEKQNKENVAIRIENETMKASTMKITSKKHKAVESKTLRDLIGSLSLFTVFFPSMRARQAFVVSWATRYEIVFPTVIYIKSRTSIYVVYHWGNSVWKFTRSAARSDREMPNEKSYFKTLQRATFAVGKDSKANKRASEKSLSLGGARRRRETWRHVPSWLLLLLTISWRQEEDHRKGACRWHHIRANLEYRCEKVLAISELLQNNEKKILREVRL